MLISCNHTTNQQKQQSGSKQLDHTDTHSTQDSTDSSTKNLKPVLGYRFIVTGDFDGDGKQEKLIEHFFSATEKKETNKFYDSLDDYGLLVDLTIKKEPISFVISDNKSIDTLNISSGGQLLGLSFLKNEGDLNGDGTDEISYVVNWADWSNLNTWHVMTYKNNKWRKLYSFPIWDWQLPDLPAIINQYGLFGLEKKTVNATINSTYLQQEKELLDFKGLVKKIKNNKIQVIFRNDEAEEDSMIVDLIKNAVIQKSF